MAESCERDSEEESDWWITADRPRRSHGQSLDRPSRGSDRWDDYNSRTYSQTSHKRDSYNASYPSRSYHSQYDYNAQMRMWSPHTRRDFDSNQARQRSHPPDGARRDTPRGHDFAAYALASPSTSHGGQPYAQRRAVPMGQEFAGLVPAWPSTSHRGYPYGSWQNRRNDEGSAQPPPSFAPSGSPALWQADGRHLELGPASEQGGQKSQSGGVYDPHISAQREREVGTVQVASGGAQAPRPQVRSHLPTARDPRHNHPRLLRALLQPSGASPGANAASAETQLASPLRAPSPSGACRVADVLPAEDLRPFPSIPSPTPCPPRGADAVPIETQLASPLPLHPTPCPSLRANSRRTRFGSRVDSVDTDSDSSDLTALEARAPSRSEMNWSATVEWNVTS